MVCTTYLSEHERTNVTDKDLLKLLDSSKYVKQYYVVRERTYAIYKRWFLIFEVQRYKTVYDIYYRYNGPDSCDAQHLCMPPGSYASTYAYFLGLINGLETTNDETSK